VLDFECNKWPDRWEGSPSALLFPLDWQVVGVAMGIPELELIDVRAAIGADNAFLLNEIE